MMRAHAAKMENMTMDETFPPVAAAWPADSNARKIKSDAHCCVGALGGPM